MESSNEKDVRQQQDNDLESNADSSADSNAKIMKTLSALNTNMASITTFQVKPHQLGIGNKGNSIWNSCAGYSRLKSEV